MYIKTLFTGKLEYYIKLYKVKLSIAHVEEVSGIQAIAPTSKPNVLFLRKCL